MKMSTARMKARAGRAIVAMTGAAVALGGAKARVGSLSSMGAGFMPLVLGLMLAATGLVLVAAPAPAGEDHRSPDARGMICVFAGVASFALLGNLAGLVPASLVSVFVAAMGDRKTSWREALVMATGATAFGVVVFSWALHLQLPLLRGN